MDSRLHTLKKSAQSAPVSPKGGYDHKIFLSPPPKELHCSVCQLTLREPQKFDCCGTIVCKVTSSNMRHLIFSEKSTYMYMYMLTILMQMYFCITDITFKYVTIDYNFTYSSVYICKYYTD